MAWLRIELTQEQQRIVNEERLSHPSPAVREKMLVIWLLHTGITRRKAAEIAGVARSTVQRYVVAFRTGGLDALRQSHRYRPQSQMASYRDLIAKSLQDKPVRTVAEACQRIFELTGLRRGPSQVRKFLNGLGFKFQRAAAIPIPPKKLWTNTSKLKPSFMTTN